MTFDLDRSTRILERTPAVLDALLRDLPVEWTHGNEGPETWSPYDVVGHLIHGERTDWMVRANIMLSESADKRFVPFDRSAHLAMDPTEPLAARLAEFAALRAANLKALAALNLTDRDMVKTGVHPAFGTVTLGQLLCTWVAHDLDHIVQISRVMAKQLTDDVGPWVEYLRVLR
ncbi:MAG: DinB family protein [Vicinamibacterales bacterium]